MAKIVIATFGSLGDIHPKVALGLELQKRGHQIIFSAMEFYREKCDKLGFEFRPMRPEIDIDDKSLGKRYMDKNNGTEYLLKEIMFPNIRPMYQDLLKNVEGADLLISSEFVFVAKSVIEKTNLKWVTASLQPGSFLSASDPFIPPIAEWLNNFYFLGRPFFAPMYFLIRRMVKSWLGDYRTFRREIGLDENHNPIFDEKFSDDLHLAMFSEVLGKPQPNWKKSVVQTGFCFYDGNQDLGKMPENLENFLQAGEPPIVFTLGSAAVMDAGDFYEQSIEAAKLLNKRAVMLYGVFNEPPKGLDADRVGFDYAPYSQLFPRACAVVHQGGVGTTSQVLRAGVPMIVMPYSHDQPDNAFRCQRLGVAEHIDRNQYNAKSVAEKLRKILSDESYQANATNAKRIIDAENGTKTACDAIEKIMKN
jgi:rhamnosyltransferase subunit B